LNEYDNNQKPANRHRKAIKVLLAVFFILIFGAGVAVFSIYNIAYNDNSRSLFTNPNKITINSSPGASSEDDNIASSITSAQKIKYKGKTYVRNTNIVNLLFLGIDYTEEREELKLGERSDMMLVCAVDTSTNKVSLISLPRDTYALIYHINSKGKVTKTDYNKLNTAYHFGNDYPAENAMACIQSFLQREDDKDIKEKLDIPLYLYASIDIDGIGPVADSVGGVDVTLTYDLPTIGNKGDKVHLSGEKAEFYIRDRHNDPEGDLGRSSKEQTFMVLLAKKIKNNNMINNIINYYTGLQKYVKTNLTTTQMIDFARILKNVDIDSIETFTIPGKNQNKSPYYYMPDDDDTMKLLLSIYYTQE
jgi:polyisoprenyl-teichoic acid--peptidoglycan teichoic acid transferase